MNRLFIFLFLFFISAVSLYAQQKERLIILADMGNEPDEEQQMVHMVMCSNEFELEGLIAVTGKYLQPASKNPYKQKLHPELFMNIIDGYEKVYDNLKIHAGGWHEPNYLRSIVASGQTGYGVAGIGEGKSSQGSELIVQSLTRDDPRPVYIVVNAGSNTLAQALTDYQRNHTKKELDEIVSKIRVYENGAQDDAGAWICANFQDIHWVRSNYQTYCYGGPAWEGNIDGSGDVNNLGPYTWEPYAYSGNGQHQWALEHIKGGHGPMGIYWPLRQFGDGRIVFLEGGGTIPWFCLMNTGLSDIDYPWWGGWSGRFSRTKEKNVWSKHASVRVDEEKYAPFFLYSEVADHWKDPQTGKEYNNIYAPVWRWRRAFFNDFKCRMDWCTAPFDKANHHPIAAFSGDTSEKIHFIQARPGETIDLDASASSDPDDDKLQFLWWVYKEAGTYNGIPEVDSPKQPITSFKVPQDAAGKQIHVILEVQDDNEIGNLFDYRRIVINVP